jgi:hypothetical protein
MRHNNSVEKPPQIEPQEERTSLDRFKTDRPARIVFSNLQDSSDVRLVDLSSGGVKLVCDASTFIPRKFFLVTAGRGIGHVRFTCHMRWRVGNTFGARFEKPLDDATVDAILNP